MTLNFAPFSVRLRVVKRRKNSDIDLLVRFSKPIGLFGFAGRGTELAEALGRKVDLATEKMIGKYIRESVFRDLKVIYDKARQRQRLRHILEAIEQNRNLFVRILI